MKKQLKQVFALCLIFCLLVSAVPVWAAEEESAQSAAKTQMSQMASSPASSSQITTQEEIVPPDASAEVTVVREEESLRGEYEKHFLMSDGSYQAVVYSYPVHELVDGVWVELPIPEQTARGDVSPGNAQQNIIDNYVWQNHGVQDNNSVRLYIGNKSGYECRAFIRFATMPTIPAGATITAATMTVNIVSGTSTANLVNAYQVDDPWESSTIQWSNMPSIGTPQEFSISHNNKTKYQFSCLEAVREWYTDSTTGQNQNYGIMLRYSDNTIADYNSVYSADCTDATMRPSMVIGYTPPNSEINVLEGYTKQLPLPDAIENITWTSSNENVATVNSNGVVTGVKAGKVTITASAGGNELHTYTVYVKIEDGIYRIGYQNENVEVYLTVLDGALENAITKMQLAATDELPMYRQLWRITYLAEGYYVMRPMHNQNLAFHAQDGVSDVTTIGYNNTLSGVPAENRCCIEYLDGGYVFKCQGDSTQALRRGGNHPGTTVYTTVYDATNSAFKWYFYNAPYITPQMLMLDTQTGTSIEGKVVVLEQGQSMTLEDLNMVVSLACTGDNNQNITWYSDSSSVEVDLSTGEILAVTGGGRAKISAQCIHNGILHEAGYRVYIKPNFDNTFFIQNGKYQGYLQLNINNLSGENGSSNASIEHWTFTDGDHQRWLIQPRANGYYSIISVDTGIALSVPSGHELTAGVSLIQEQYTGNDRQLWKIITTNDGRCKIKAKSAESSGSDLVIAVGGSGGNGANIVQSSYIYDDNYADEWCLAEIGYASDVQVEGQQKEWWCWVTCARMFAKHFYPDVSYTQTQAVEHVFGGDVNQGGTTENTQKAIAFYLSTASSLYVETQENNQSIYSEATLLRFLDDGYVVEVGRIEYPELDKEKKGNGHGVLIYGYVTIGTEHRFLVRDPAPMNIGSSYMMSYGKLCIGQNAQWGEEADEYVWETSVVVKTTYSDDIIPYYFGNHH